MSSLVVSIGTGLIGLFLQATVPVDAGLQQAIRGEIGSQIGSGRLSVGDNGIIASDLIGKIYEQRQFAPAWDEPEQIELLIEAVRSGYHDGLTPADYRLATIEEVHRAVLAGHEFSVSKQAGFDLLLTDSLIRLVYHLNYGKVDPETYEPARTFGQPLDGREASTVIEEIIASDDFVTAISSITPHNPDYDRLKAQLKQHRLIAAAGGWPEVPKGPTLRPAANDPRVETLAARLEISGDLISDNTRVPAGLYDLALQDAVRDFQARHGLEEDGLVGRATLRALNVPIEQRIDQIRLNLERARWRFNKPMDDLILVNVPGFKMYVIRDQEKLLAKKVIVGDAEDPTPLFQATLKHIVFNPSWTVPYSIASEEILPRIKENPDYLEKGKYRLLDQQGNVIDASTVDWTAIHTNNFPFTVVQKPGPANQLGQVKFLFPNQYSVCMHDTPEKLLFTRVARALSHGCIRVDEPVDLAEVLLGNHGWTRLQIDAQIESGETRTVVLKEPLPVVMLYRTAEVNDQGQIHFYSDIYEQDAAVLAAL